MPGLVDVHVHISDRGRDFEGYYTATKAAAADGITTHWHTVELASTNDDHRRELLSRTGGSVYAQTSCGFWAMGRSGAGKLQQTRFGQPSEISSTEAQSFLIATPSIGGL